MLSLAYGSSALLSFAEVPPFPQSCGFLCGRVTFAHKADHLLTVVLLVAEGCGGSSRGGHDPVDSGHDHDLVVSGVDGSVDHDHDLGPIVDGWFFISVIRKVAATRHLQ